MACSIKIIKHWERNECRFDEIISRKEKNCLFRKLKSELNENGAPFFDNTEAGLKQLQATS